MLTYKRASTWLKMCRWIARLILELLNLPVPISPDPRREQTPLTPAPGVSVIGQHRRHTATPRRSDEQDQCSIGQARIYTTRLLVCQSVSLSFSLPSYLFICNTVAPPKCLYSSLSVCLSLSFFLSLSVCLSILVCIKLI